jgi:soluble lytic murein transglycosylase-like protein
VRSVYARIVAALAVAGFSLGLAACRPGAPPASNLARNPYLAYCADTGNVGCINQIVAQIFPAQQGLVVCIIGRESGYDVLAHNPSGASGLMQLILPLHDDMFTAAGYDPSQWGDAYANLSAAFELSGGGSNFSAWHGDCGL